MPTATQRNTETSYGAMNSAGNTFDQYINFSTVYVGHSPNDAGSNGYVGRFRFPAIDYASVVSELKLFLYFKAGYTSAYRAYVSDNPNLTPYQVVNGSAALIGDGIGITPADGGAVTTGKFYRMDLTAYGDIINDFPGDWYLYLYKPAQAAGRSEFQGGTGSQGAYLDFTYTTTTFTACGGPTSTALSATVAEGNASLTVAGATGGASNPITGFEVQHSESDDNVNWGAWAFHTSVSTGSGSGTITVSPSSTRGKYRRFRVRTMGAAGEAYYSEWVTVPGSLRKNSNPTAPTVFTASPALRESGVLTLAWSGQTDADGNIASYVIQYAIRSVAGVWGAWQGLQSAGASGITHTPALADGERIRYQIKAVDALGAESDWKVSNEVTQNSNPTAPTVFTASPALRESGVITLAWSGQTDADGNITSYVIQYAIRSVAGVWGAWQGLQSAGASGITTTPALADGERIRYQIKAVDALGAESGWKVSNEVTQNSDPIPPAVIFPGAGKTTYNAQPYVGLTISAEPDGQVQTLFFKVDGGAAQNAGAVSAGTKKLQMPAMAAGNRTLRFWLADSQGAVSAEAVVTITVAANTYTRTIAQGVLLWDEEKGRRTSVEMLELKSRVNQMRAFYGLAAISLPYEGSEGANTTKHMHTWAQNMVALYQGLADTCAVSGAVAPARVTRARNAPSAGIVNQVRNMIGSL